MGINLVGVENGLKAGLAEVGLAPPPAGLAPYPYGGPRQRQDIKPTDSADIANAKALLDGAEADVHRAIMRRNKAARDLQDAKRDDAAPEPAKATTFVCAVDAPHAANSRITELVDDLMLCDEDVRERFVDALCAGLGMGNYASDSEDIAELGMSICNAGADARGALMAALLAAHREYRGEPPQIAPIDDRAVLKGYKEPYNGR